MVKVRLGDVAREYKETCKGSKDGFPIVGLEHLIPEEINLKMWDEEKKNTFTKMFRKGQVLFGRRRAYLKKAAVAPFDGICSGDITVIEAIHDKILPELLPFIIQNDSLFNFAVGNSAGSLSPRVKWENLKNYEFDLPDLAKQKSLTEVLWAAIDTKEAYKKLLALTDDLVKSQFIEMFGDIDSNPKGWEMKTWGEVLAIQNGKDYKKVQDINGLYPIYGSGGIMGRSTEFLCPENTVIIGRKGTINNPILVREPFWNVDTAFGLIPNPSILNDMYFFRFCILYDFERHNKATVLPSLTKSDLLKILIQLPPLELQEQFAAFVQQTDKSKFELQQTILSLENTLKSLMLQNVF
jgi:type I restriction enzyme, S subunit